jgi:hypothetical protein
VKRSDLDTPTVAQLVARFAQIGLEQDHALLREDIPRVNELYDQLKEIELSLKRLDGDQRHALIPLHQHPNMQVRMKAAKATLAIAPEASRATLESIRAANWQPQSLEAGMSLRRLDDGLYKPT